jgi:hypothetical protein
VDERIAIRVARFDQRDRRIGVFGEITRNDAAGRARANNDNVVPLLGHQCLSLSHHFYRSINARSWRSAITVPDPEIDWTIFWKVTFQRWRGKSPLAIESIDDRYCRSPRRMMP